MIVLRIVLCLLVGLCVRAHAQEPVDNDVWKSRCLMLSAQSEAIDKGSAPPELLQTTRGIPGVKFAAVGQGRANAGQHYIACTMYYTAAMAEHMGNGGKIDTGRAHTYLVLAGAEAKRAAGLPLSFKEKMDRTSGKLNPRRQRRPYARRSRRRLLRIRGFRRPTSRRIPLTPTDATRPPAGTTPPRLLPHRSRSFRRPATRPYPGVR